MKIFLLLALFVGPLPAFSSYKQNSCSKELFNLDEWSQLPTTALNCLNLNSDFKSGISFLCSADRRHLSEEYMQYVFYKK